MTVTERLVQHGLAAYVARFEAERVSLDDLRTLSDADLQEGFGVTSFMDRKRFRALIAALGDGADGGASRVVPSPGSARDGVTRVDTPPPRDAGATRVDTPPPGATRVDAALPSRLGSYDVLGIVGTGGMGTVVRARHVNAAWAAEQGGDVAIKLIHPDIATEPSFQARFAAEAALGRTIRHPSFVETYDIVSDGPWLGTVMALVEGEPLTRRVRTGGVTLDEAVALLAPVAAALDHLHSQGVVHRDVKPDNILVRADGTPVVLDLGIAKVETSDAMHTRAMTSMGTSAWMAPEQADAASVDGAADRYALGLVAYALLAGRLPWPDGLSEFRVVAMKLAGQVAPLETVRAGLATHVGAALTRMLSVAPGDRFASCVAFIDALRAPASATVRRTIPTVAPADCPAAPVQPSVAPATSVTTTSCTKCGARLGGAKFCTTCGSPTAVAKPTEAAQSTAAERAARERVRRAMSAKSAVLVAKLHLINIEVASRPDECPPALEAGIKALGKWSHRLRGMWIVETRLNNAEIRDALKPDLDVEGGDRLFVMSLGPAWAGSNLGEGFQEWMAQRTYDT